MSLSIHSINHNSTHFIDATRGDKQWRFWKVQAQGIRDMNIEKGQRIGIKKKRIHVLLKWDTLQDTKSSGIVLNNIFKKTKKKKKG